MNKTVFFILLLFSICSSAQQNLVPNPSFEIYDTCPEQVSDPLNYELEHALYWRTPSEATSDYFNSCNQQVNNVSVPLNFIGYQIPYSGNCYAGIYLLLPENDLSWYEYIESELTSNLIDGKEYSVSFRVNLANHSNFAVDEIGLWFTNGESNHAATSKMFSYTPDIINTFGFLTDTTEWIEIKGNYIANGSESNIIIGFYTDSTNLTASVEPMTPFAAIEDIDSYYYIDDVSVKENNPIDNYETYIPNVITPNEDGINDNFKLSFPYSRVFIFNRWGNLIWNGSNGQYWNGKTQDDVDVSEGTYFYVIETNEEKKQGFIQVVR